MPRMPGRKNPGTLSSHPFPSPLSFPPSFLPFPSSSLPPSFPGSIEYDHFGFCVLITDEALKSVSIYLDGEANLVDPAAPPPPSSLPPSAEALSNLVEGKVPVSAATAAVDEGKEDRCVV